MKNNKFLKIFLIIITIYSIIGFIVIPNVAKYQIEKILNENLSQKVTLQTVAFNPFTLSVSLEGFKIFDEKQTTVSFDKIYVDFFLIKSLDERHISFKEVKVDKLFVNLIENSDGSFNLEKLYIPKEENKEKEETTQNNEDGIKFQISKTALENANIKFTKYFKNENKNPLVIDLNPLNYSFYDIGTYKNTLASHSLNLNINKHTNLRVDGGLRLTPFNIYGNIYLDKLYPTDFIPYKDDNLNFDIDKNTFLNLKVGYRLSMNETLDLKIENSDISLQNLKLSQKNKQLLGLEELKIEVLNYFYPENKALIKDITLDKLSSNVVIDKSSTLNFTTLIKPSKNNQEEAVVEDKEEEKANPINLTLDSFALKNSSVNFDDLSSLLSVKVNGINININDTKYIDEKINVSKIDLDKLNLKLSDKKNSLYLTLKDLGLNLENINNFKDKVDIEKLLLTNQNMRVLNRPANTNLETKNLNLTIDKLTYEDNKLVIKNTLLDKPIVDITLNKSNSKKIETKEVKTDSKVVKKDKNSFSFDIGPFKIVKAKMSFQDKNLPIPFKTTVTDLNGDFSQLKSNSSKPTKLKLEGQVDKYGYSKITGIVDINDIKLLTDTNLIFKNIAIKNFTPYSGKFVGRKIESGKLNLDLRYNIKKSDLKAKNTIVISDIKLGEQVQSEDAVNLPLELAIALLEDTDGVIQIDLPIEGNVDDPQFSIAPIVWKAFTNLIVKAITSPFRLLASIFGISEDEIKSLDFEFGKSAIISSEKEALDNIAKILSKKQRLAIKIEPTYHEIKDKEALQLTKFNGYINKQIEKIKGKDKDKYLIAIEEYYKSQKKISSLKKIKEKYYVENKEGKKVLDKTSYINFMKDYLVSIQRVSTKELEDLAKQRAQNVVTYLTKEKKLSKDSIVINENVAIQNDPKETWTKFNLEVQVR